MIFERFIFGSTLDLVPQKQIKKLKIAVVVFIFLIVSLLSSSVFLIIAIEGSKTSMPLFYKFTKTFYNETSVDLHELSESEQKVAMRILMDIKPAYLKAQKNITFTKDIQGRYGKEIPVIGGFNRGGQLFVKWYPKDIIGMKKILCHEMLHSYMYPDDTTHNVLFDVEDYLPCYKTTKKLTI